jgi:hypothetical protein
MPTPVKSLFSMVSFRLLKVAGVLLSLLLGLFTAFSCSKTSKNIVTPLYGMPVGVYKISGTVRDSATRAVMSGIRVILQDTTTFTVLYGAPPGQPLPTYHNGLDTAYSSVGGNYSLRFEGSPTTHPFIIYAANPDSTYKPKDTQVVISDSAVIGGSGEVQVDLYLPKK